MKRVKQYLSILLSMLLVLGTLATPVAANEQTEVSWSKTVVNPLYEDVISLEEAEQELAAIKEQTVSVFSWGRSVTPKFNTAEELGTYVREQMVNRAESITFAIPASLFDYVIEGGFITEAIKYSESCNGQEGDALAFGFRYYNLSISGYGDNYDVTCTMSYYANAEQEQQLTARVNQAMSEMALDGKSELEKAKTIYEYVCSHVAYDYTYSKYAAYNALVEGEAVCQGFATLFYRLCKEAGLSVRIISGMAGGPHAWNIVRIGNVYYNMDTTWDDESTSGNYEWIFKSEKEFSSHTRDASYVTRDFYLQYPMADSSLNWDGSTLTYNKLDVQNYAYTYETIDGESVTTTANGKPKLLMYYNDECINSLNTIVSLAGTPIKDVDIVAIEMTKASKDAVKAVREKYGNNRISFTYDATNTSSGNMWTYARVGGYANSISWPVIIFIDANNKIQHVSSGSSDATTVTNKLEKLCNYTPNRVNSISLNQSTLFFEAGSTNSATLTATVNPSDAVNNRIVWSSSNPNVCSVDNGVVTPVGTGNAVITVNVGDESCVKNNLYATCDVTVGSEDTGNDDTGNDNTGEDNTGNGGTGEAETEPPYFGWHVSKGKNYWYEDGKKQGTYDDPQGVLGDGTVRGREIYDPGSDGWYWLDAVYDGAKAINKEVWMPYIYQNEATWPEEEIRFNAEASGDMAEQVIREINNRTGKWVRYDENGKMYKGWYTVEGAQAAIYPDQVGNTYYYDHRTGLMAKGEVEIDGVVYYFDPVTGVLQW